MAQRAEPAARQRICVWHRQDRRAGREVGSQPRVVAKGKRKLHFSGLFGQGAKLKLTAKGPALRSRGASFRAKVTITVTDGSGATVTYSRRVRLRGP